VFHLGKENHDGTKRSIIGVETGLALFGLAVSNSKREFSSSKRDFPIFVLFGLKQNSILCTVILSPDVSFLEARKPSFCGKET
jgi:hypothetical protein